jgi:hypothetical protein
VALVAPGSYFAYRQSVETAALMQPPPLLTSEQLGTQKLLFDSRTTDGWRITGPSRVEDGTLVIGGSDAAKAELLYEFQPEATVNFHFKHEGQAGATSYPNDAIVRVIPAVDWQQPPEAELRQSALTPEGPLTWHEGVIRSHHAGGLQEFQINLKQRIGRASGPLLQHSRGIDPCRFTILFETAPGNRLLLRNVSVAQATP